jgi:hypothetical protein
VFSNLGFDQFCVMSVQPSQGSLIVDAYQAAVTGYIRHQDCHKSALDLVTSHS